MKIKPVIYESFQAKHTSFEIDFKIQNNITFIIGDSGVGKSAVFYIFQESTVENKNIKCINYLNVKSNYKNSIKNSKGKLFVIDNADILLDDKIRSYIALDNLNQYIIIGRNPSGLLLTQDEIYEINSIKTDEKTIFTLVNAF